MTLADGAVAQQTRRATAAPTQGHRAALVAIGVLVAVALTAGAVLLAGVPSARAARNTYNAATPYRCGHATPPAGIACWQGIDGRLTAITVRHNAVGLRESVATVATTGGVLSVVVQPAPALSCVTQEMPVVVRLSGGTVTTLFTPQGTLATAANPNVDPDTAWTGGIALVATGLLIPCALWLSRLRRRNRGEGPDVIDAYGTPLMRIAVLVFLTGQAADVVTSAIGQSVGLSEGNSLVDVFVRSIGPLGFLIFRLPAVVLVLLGLSQVPRRIAAIALIGMGAVFISVGVHNAVLAAGTDAPPACSASVSLP